MQNLEVFLFLDRDLQKNEFNQKGAWARVLGALTLGLEGLRDQWTKLKWMNNLHGDLHNM